VVDLQAEQKHYVQSRGYSIGYNFCVDYIGHRWILRGMSYKCAANGDSAVNTKGVAIQLKVDINQVPTDQMIQGTRDMIADIRDHVGRNLYINGHRDVRPEPTSCPGDVIYRMIGEGAFEPTGQLPNTGTGVQDVAVAIACMDGSPEQNFATFAWNPGTSIGWITSQWQESVGRITGTLIFDGGSGEPVMFTAVEIQDMIDRYWVGTEKPPGWR